MLQTKSLENTVIDNLVAVRALGVELALAEGEIRCRMTVAGSHSWVFGVVALLDAALRAEASRYARAQGLEVEVVDFKADYETSVRPGQTIVTRSAIEFVGNMSVVVRAEVENVDTGERVASAVSTFNLWLPQLQHHAA